MIDISRHCIKRANFLFLWHKNNIITFIKSPIKNETNLQRELRLFSRISKFYICYDVLLGLSRLAPFYLGMMLSKQRTWKHQAKVTLGALKTFRCHRMEVTYEALLRKPHGLFRPWYCSTCSTHQLQSRDEVHLEAKLTCHSFFKVISPWWYERKNIIRNVSFEQWTLKSKIPNW